MVSYWSELSISRACCTGLRRASKKINLLEAGSTTYITPVVMDSRRDVLLSREAYVDSNDTLRCACGHPAGCYRTGDGWLCKRCFDLKPAP